MDRTKFDFLTRQAMIVRTPVRYLIIGALAGAANGLFGAGGGLFLVPLLTGWCGLTTKQALATSVAAVLPLSVVSLVVFLLRGEMPWGTALPYVLGGIAGGCLSGRLFARLSAVWLKRLFAILLLIGGIRAVVAV